MDPAKSPPLRGSVIVFLLLGVGALVGHFVRVWWIRTAEVADRSADVAIVPRSEQDLDPETDWTIAMDVGQVVDARQVDEALLIEFARPRLADQYPDALPLPPEWAELAPPQLGETATAATTPAADLEVARGANGPTEPIVERGPRADAESGVGVGDPSATVSDIAAKPAVAAAIEAHGPELDAARPSVVGITTIHRRGGFDEDRAETYGDADGLPPSSDASSFGTGVLFDPAGLVLTALHVVADPEQILVQVPGVGTREAQLVGADPSTDLAVLRLESRLVPGDSDEASREHFATATFASEYDVARGDIVFALANAYHFREPLSAGVVEEVVAHIRHVAVPPVHITNEYLKFDAASAPGTSGSPVFDRRGEVVGVLTRSGRTGKDSYALTSRTVRRVLDAMERGGGRVDRGHLGVSVQPVRPDGRLRGLVPEDGIGVLVDEAHPGYPAERSGLQSGDVIVRYEGRTIPNLSTFYEWVTWSEPGSMVELEVVRGDQPIAPVAVQLGTVGDPPGETG